MVHLATVYAFSLQQPEDVTKKLAALLSEDEERRAARFVFEHLRQRFRNGRGLLRCVLGAEVGVSPESLAFEYGENGKPSLREWPGVQFNVSHSGNVWMCAISHGRRVGIDVEETREMKDAMQICSRFFSPDEVRSLHLVPEARRSEAFLNCWTRKEAFLKVTGEGLQRPLDSFSVTLDPEAEPALLVVDGAAPSAGSWKLLAFTPQPGTVAALVLALQDGAPVSGSILIRLLPEAPYGGRAFAVEAGN